MLDPFYKLRSPIQKACTEIKAIVHVTDSDFHTVGEMVAVLEPEKMSVEVPCHRETNQITAAAALKFAVVQEEKQRSELGNT
jgi:hypothetical protein